MAYTSFLIKYCQLLTLSYFTSSKCKPLLNKPSAWACCKCAAKLVQTREKETCFLFRVQPSLTLVKYGNKQRYANLHSTTAKVVQMSGISKQIRSFVLYSRVQPILFKGSALPQKHMIKCLKNYKWNTSKITNGLHQKLKIKHIKNLKYVW